MLLSIVLLCIGELIYLLYRPITLLMFKLFEVTGTISVVHYLRNSRCFPLQKDIPEWVIYNFSDGLWLLSFLLLMEFIWYRNTSHVKLYIIYTISSFIILCELLQYFAVIPGTWDMGDLVAYFIAIIIYHVLAKML